MEIKDANKILELLNKYQELEHGIDNWDDFYERTQYLNKVDNKVMEVKLIIHREVGLINIGKDKLIQDKIREAIK